MYAVLTDDDVARHLSMEVAIEKMRRRSEDVTLFCSVGLAGTEVVLASELLRRASPP